jgi:hypothetical protein
MSFAEALLVNSYPSNPDDIERDIGDLLQISNRGLRSTRIAPNEDHSLSKGSVPDYVEHKEGVNQLGKLSAEALVLEYDAAVKEIEALGAELTEAANKCEAMVAGVHSVVNEIKELAANYREEGKRYFLQIEECSLMTSEVRIVCENLKKKLAAAIAA